jgi:virginiamycin B lyase
MNDIKVYSGKIGMHMPSVAAILIATSISSASAAASGINVSSTANRQPLSQLPIVERINVPVGPAWLAIGFGSVWLSKSKSHLVLRIDPVSNQIIAKIRVGSDPELGIGIGLGFVWIVDPKDRSLTQIDPGTNHVLRTTPVNVSKETEGAFGVGAGSLWILTDEGGTVSGTLSRIDPATGKIIANIAVGSESHSAIMAMDSVWVTSSAHDNVMRIDPESNSVVAEIPVPRAPRFIAAGEGSIWVLSQGDGTLTRIDPHSNQVVATIAVGVPGPGGDLSIGEGSVWVAAERVPLSQIDPHSNRLVRQFVGGELDDTLRVGFGSAWVVDEGHGQIWRVDLDRLRQMPFAPR